MEYIYNIYKIYINKYIFYDLYVHILTFLAHEGFHLPLLEFSRVVGREGT